MIISDFLSELERELGLRQVMNDKLARRQDRITKRIREFKVAQHDVQWAKCICVNFINGNPDLVANPDCPIHGALRR